MPVDGGTDYVDGLRTAIEAHDRFVAEGGRRSANESLAEHEQLRDLLEPLLASATHRPHPYQTSTRVLGDFRLLRKLGRGGMCVVYDAEQISLSRRVAVNVLPSGLAASLDHPGIAKVISAEADDDAV